MKEFRFSAAFSWVASATLAASVATPLLLAACGDDPAADVPAACNPLGGLTCLAPFPSSVYLVEDSSTATGFRVDFPVGALPVNVDKKVVDNAFYNRYDGFSPNPLIVVAFEGGVSDANLPGHEDLAASLAADSPTVIVDMDTGERMLHFAELDHNAKQPTDQALLLRAAVRFQPGHRYAVAIRKSLKAAGGGELPITPGFQALLDGKDYDHPLFARIAPRYPDIFAALEAAGVARTDLALAWDFVTASDEFLTEDLRTMRAKALPEMANDGAALAYSATLVSGAANENVLRAVLGKYEAPSFLSNGEADDSEIVRGADGLPALNGKFMFNYAAIIPKCAETTRPLPVLIFGHGLFGSGEDYVDGGLLQRVANENCVVVVAGDWIGLTNRNVATVALAINDINKGRALTEKLMQAVINFMALSRIVKGPMSQDPLFQVNGEPIVDPTRVWYFGASLGGIMGGTFMSYEPDVGIAALGVPGCNWTICFERSFAWPALQIALQGAYPGFVLNEEVIALMGMAFDRVDPITTAPSLLAGGGVVETPGKKIWVYETLGDSLVSNVATEMMGRTLGIPVTGPSVRVPYGMSETFEVGGSAFTVFDEHPSPMPSPFNLAPSDDNGTHAGVHNRNAVISMLRVFFETGVIEHACALDGAKAPCDCATSACDVALPVPVP